MDSMAARSTGFLDELPDGTVKVDHDLNTDVATIVIDWSEVPEDIRYGGQQ